MICKDTKIWKYKSWLAQMKGWKDEILFAKIQRYKTASKTYTTETAHQAERMHDHDVSWKFIRVNQCIWNFIWSEKRFFESIDVSGKCVDISKREKNPFNFATRFVCKECVISSTELLCAHARNSACWKLFSKKLMLWKFQIVNSFAGRYLSLRRVI